MITGVLIAFFAGFAAGALVHRFLMATTEPSPHREDYIEANRLLTELAEKRRVLIGELQAERDNFAKACEETRKEALRDLARADEQIAYLRAELAKLTEKPTRKVGKRKVASGKAK